MWAVSIPRNSIGPAGYRINRDYARRGWATETGHLNWGPLSWTPLRCRTVEVVRSSCSDSSRSRPPCFLFFSLTGAMGFTGQGVKVWATGQCGL